MEPSWKTAARRSAGNRSALDMRTTPTSHVDATVSPARVDNPAQGADGRSMLELFKELLPQEYASVRAAVANDQEVLDFLGGISPVYGSSVFAQLGGGGSHKALCREIREKLSNPTKWVEVGRNRRTSKPKAPPGAYEVALSDLP